jgi:hypothetical protein
MRRHSLALCLPVLFAGSVVACGDGPDAASPARPPIADKWLARAKNGYRTGDLDDAAVSLESALKSAPKDPETRLLGAKIALARLDYAQTIKLTEGVATSESRGLRGRAFWYQGDIERAADELEEMLRDPAVKDPWARDVSKLARRGQGRHPFAIEGASLASVEMPAAGPAMVVPVELDGERVLALVATAMGELMIDNATRKDPSWVSMRFGERLEVQDVPALPYDLSSISKQLGAPIKALLGVNLLRHAHATFDRRGSQFVVRKFDPPAPPEAAKVPVFYVRGGGMMIRSQVTKQDDGALLFVDSAAFYPLALDDQQLKRSGADLASFRQEPGAPPNWKMGFLPFFRLGTLDLPQVPVMQGAPIAEYKGNFEGVDLGGVVGAGLMSAFRVTFADEGRYVWMELDPSLSEPPREPRARSAAPSGPPPLELRPPPGVTPGAAKPAPGKPDAKPDAKKPGTTTESKGAAK